MVPVPYLMDIVFLLFSSSFPVSVLTLLFCHLATYLRTQEANGLHCIMAVLPDPQDIAYQKSHPDDDMTDRLIVSTVVCSVLSIFAVMLRLYARHLTKGGLGKDDYMMLLALV